MARRRPGDKPSLKPPQLFNKPTRQGPPTVSSQTGDRSEPQPTQSYDPSSAVIRVVAAVVQQGGRYLLCQRPLNKRHPGLWEFPGGKIRDGETPTEAAGRELREELAVVVTRVDPYKAAIHDPGSPFRIEFYPTVIEGDPRSLEHQEIRWLRPDEVLDLDLAPSDRQFAEAHLAPI